MKWQKKWSDGDNMNEKKTSYKIIILLSVLIPLAILITIYVIFYINYNKKNMYDYSNMHQEEINYYELNGNIMLPDEWMLKKEEDYYYICNKINNEVLGFQIYNGYTSKNKYLIDYWQDYSLNPKMKEYDYKNLYFISIYSFNGNYLKKNENFYELYFMKNNEDGKTYILEFLIVSNQNENLLKKIIASYSEN